jgi:hypothetical protein
MKNRLFCAALLLSSLQFGLAQSTTNLTTFSFGLPLVPVWDVSGTYQITNYMQGVKFAPTVIVFNDLGLDVDAKGKLQGPATIIVSFGDDMVGGDCKVSGKITGGGTKTKVKFTIQLKNGNGNVAGVQTTCNINATYDLTINPAGTNMVGTTTGNAHFSSLGSGSLKGPVSMALPAGVDGGWNVAMDVIPFNRKLSGSAIVTVNNPVSPFPLNAKANGNLPSNSSSAKMKLTGYGNSAGTQLNMQFVPIFGATNLAATINGKVLGQKVKN